MSAIGEQSMNRILDVTDELEACVREKFEPYEGVYRLNESGEYVSESDWLDVWEGRPTWWHKAWMLADNGQYTTSAVAAMSVAEIERAYDDPCFEPQYAFYTEVDGCVSSSRFFVNHHPILSGLSTKVFRISPRAAGPTLPSCFPA